MKFRVGRYVTLTVTDTGAGIRPEVRAHVFEPFFTTKANGTGLGLATVYGIVKQSGGHILLHSEVGIGTTFAIYLPRVEKPVEQLLPDPIRTDALVGRETILIAEDAASLRRMTREVLELAGYTILEAENGSHAVEVALRHPAAIDLLVTDVVMPMMGGRELAERLTEARPGIKVLYTSGYTDDQAFSPGEGEAFLQKPFAPGELLRKVREMLDATGAPSPMAANGQTVVVQ